MTFAAGGIPCLTLRYDRSGLVETDEVQLLQKTEEALMEMKEVLL